MVFGAAKSARRGHGDTIIVGARQKPPRTTAKTPDWRLETAKVYLIARRSLGVEDACRPNRFAAVTRNDERINQKRRATRPKLGREHQRTHRSCLLKPSNWRACNISSAFPAKKTSLSSMPCRAQIRSSSSSAVMTRRPDSWPPPMVA